MSVGKWRLSDIEWGEYHQGMQDVESEESAEEGLGRQNDSY
jgi:hypothetical protein